MVDSAANRKKAEWIIGVLGGNETDLRYDFNRLGYETHVHSGPYSGRVLFIPTEWLEDEDLSLFEIRDRLLAKLNKF